MFSGEVQTEAYLRLEREVYIAIPWAYFIGTFLPKYQTVSV